MDQISAPTPLTEIAVCSGAGDSLRACRAIDAFGRTVQRFDRADGWNPQAKQVCEAMRRAICEQHALKPQEFEIRPQSWIEPADGSPDAFRTGWALLLRTRAEHRELVDPVRVDAFRVASLLNRRASRLRQVVTAGAAPSAVALESQITLEHLASEPLLGARLKTAIDVYVAEHPTLRLAGMLKRRPGRDLSRRSLSVGGARLDAAKLAGRTRHVSVVGTDKSTGESCRLDRVLFDERWRRLIAAAIEDPLARLTLEVEHEILDTGRSKPRHTYTLVDVIVSERSSAVA